MGIDSLVRCHVHFYKVFLTDAYHAVLVDVETFSLLRLVQLVDLSLFFNEIFSHFFVLHLAHMKRFMDILSHLLLFKAILPLLNLKVLSIDLLEV